MNNEKEKSMPASHESLQADGCGCEKAGKSQKMAEDQTTENDIMGASHYEKVESDQSTGIFARQTEAYNRAMEEIQQNDDENAKDNLSDYMDELKEESEVLNDHPKPYGDTEDSSKFPAEGKFTPPFNV